MSHTPCPLAAADRVRVPRRTSGGDVSHTPYPLAAADRVRVPRRTQEAT
ncbi:hypothetical protein [Saccharopolyspora taberi]|uniref:Uncharacterized protein n=1 Tax=Saccharopolyspora taberi TaxID=60895 RepID=A0ABN3VME3_9PSEU